MHDGSGPWVTLATAEPLLVAVIGLLVLVIAGLVAMAIVLRRRNQPPASADSANLPVRARVAQVAPPSPPPRPRPRAVRGGGGAGLAMATSSTASSAMVCPTCRTEYHGLMYCTRDARRLVSAEEMFNSVLRTPGRSAGLVCMACRRAYEPGLRSCPHDGNELVPSQVYNATRPRRTRTSEPTGVVARICPVCATKYDLSARFCGHDAGELVVIN
jgi:hypothetical protein